jgi:phosphonate transport system substrate-binding protein
MKNVVFRTLAIALAAAALAVSGAQASEVGDLGDIEELNFGIISTESTAGLQKGFEPFLKDMSEALGMKVNAFFAPDYAGVIEGMRFGKVHVAWYGNKSAMEAVDRANGEIFAQTVDASGNPGYWSLIIVHKDSPFGSVEEIIAGGKDLTFGNGDPNSTSGYLIPSYYLWAQHGIDPVRHFKRVTNANHETNALSVATKRVDFATNNTESLSRVEVNQPELFQNIKVVWKSPLIPSDPLVWRKDLPRELKAKIKGFVLGYGRNGADRDRQLAVLAGMSSGWAPFHNSDNRQLLPIREIALVKDISKLEAQESLGESEKKKLSELKADLEELKTYQSLLAKFNDNAL